MKIERLLAIVLMLFSRRKMTAPQLAKQFNVSVRTIYRDIDAIDAAGIPIVSNQGTGGGYSIIDSYKLEQQLFSSKDILAILGALQGIGTALGDDRVVDSSDKLKSLVPKDELQNFNNEIKIEFSPWGDMGRYKTTLAGIQQAIRNRICVKFVYFNTTGTRLMREIEPLTLVFKGSSWYLFGFCKLKEDYRLFKISRIREFTRTENYFVRKPLTYDQFAKRSIDTAVEQLVDFELKFSPCTRYAVEDFFNPNDIQINSDGSLLVKTQLPMGDWTIGMVMSYGENIEVIKPKTLRKKIRIIAEQLAKRHRK